MAAFAGAFKISEVEADQKIVSALTKDCEKCDPDNPRAVPRETCATCMGTGHQSLAVAAIAAEITKSRLGLSSVPKSNDGDDDDDDGGGSTESNDSDLYLEY